MPPPLRQLFLTCTCIAGAAPATHSATERTASSSFSLSSVWQAGERSPTQRISAWQHPALHPLAVFLTHYRMHARLCSACSPSAPLPLTPSQCLPSLHRVECPRRHCALASRMHFALRSRTRGAHHTQVVLVSATASFRALTRLPCLPVLMLPNK